MKEFLYIDTASTDAYYNFGVEYYFASQSPIFRNTSIDGVFMLWRTSPTLMVGKYQNALEEINKPYTDEKGIKVVRRMSGGGTIYTDEGGWQYTFITSGSSGNIRFSEFLVPVIAALNDLGVPAIAGGRNDIIVDGRKVSGNAQYMIKDKTVHHGTLLFSSAIEEMVKSTTVDASKIISKGIASVRERVVNLNEYLPDLTPETFRDELLKRLVPASKIYTLSPAEISAAKELAKEKFESWDMIYGGSPKFSICREHRFPSGLIRAYLDVKGGVITNCSFEGDFFSATVEPADIASLLIGAKYNRESILSTLNSSNVTEIIYGVNNQMLAELLCD